MRRRVLVTGAGSGFGLATVLHLAELGFEAVGLVPPGDERSGLEEAAAGRGVAIDVIEADLADPSARRHLLAGRDLWALVNNAGYMNAGQVVDVPVADARRQLETMVLAAVDLVQQALPSMLVRGQGRIVDVTTSAVHTSTPLTGWYQATKAALREINDSLRVELRGTGVEVIDIEPGGFKTGIWPRAADELRERMAGSGRPGLYARVLSNLDRAEEPMGDAERVAAVIGDVLTQGQPKMHRRIGPGAHFLRVANEIVPDRVWDRLVATGTRLEG